MDLRVADSLVICGGMDEAAPVYVSNAAAVRSRADSSVACSAGDGASAFYCIDVPSDADSSVACSAVDEASAMLSRRCWTVFGNNNNK